MPKRELRSGSGASRVHDVMYAWASAPGINHTLKSIEDAVAISLGQIDGQEVAMFGVYDGHAGRHVSQYLKNHLFEKVTDEPEFEKEDYEGALRRAYCEMNREILFTEWRLHLRRGGAVAVTALLIDAARAVVANAGDARAILCKEDGTVEELTETHRANNPREARRVRARGGEVVCRPETGVCRVDGRLMPSRGFGDLDVSNHITAEPHVWSGALPESRTSFLVLASDGLWDAMGDLEVAEMVKSRGDAAREEQLEAVARDLVCASERGGSKDDVSVIVCRVRRAGKKRRRGAGNEKAERGGRKELEWQEEGKAEGGKGDELEGGDEEDEEEGVEEEELEGAEKEDDEEGGEEEDEQQEGVEEEENGEGEEDEGIVPYSRLAGG